MKFIILTLFPEEYESFLNASIIARAIKKGLIEVDLVNIRDFTEDRYHRVDTPPVGGGAGLIMKCQPILDALKSVDDKEAYKIALSPRGKLFDQKKAIELSNKDELIILCGHYEGFDERIYPHFDESISIGDYVLTGGETASFVLIDAISRLIPGVISEDSTKEESFSNGLLEYPQYTEPYDYDGEKIPDILYSGNHEAIARYRHKRSLKLTKDERPDLFAKLALGDDDKSLLKEIDKKETPSWELKAIEKGTKFTKKNGN
jgi:tRNA (guanine37-N1)-methyltransferase